VLTLHLIETILLAAGEHLTRGKTDAGIGLEKLLGNNAGGASLHLLLILIVDGGVLGLELLNEGVDILVLFFVLLDEASLGRERLLVVLSLLVLQGKLAKSWVIGWADLRNGCWAPRRRDD